MTRQNTITDFEAAYEKHESGCWLWTRSKDSKGYGLFRGPGHSFRAASKWAWIFYRGPIPDGLCVCHSCDNPACVNPEHLWLGTIGDNNRDARAKGRNHRPARNTNNATLTPEQVRAIRADSGPAWKVGRKYGVGYRAVEKIRSGERWSWLD